MLRYKIGKALKRQGYYIDFLEIGSTVAKVSGKTFKDRSKTDRIVGFGLKHQYTDLPFAYLENNPPVDLRQLRPTDVELPERYRRGGQR